MASEPAEPTTRQDDPNYYGYAGSGSPFDEIPELTGHNHRVFFPGDTVPAGTPVVNHVGGVWRHHADRVVKTGHAIEITLPTTEECQATVDRAKAARADSEHTEGAKP